MTHAELETLLFFKHDQTGDIIGVPDRNKPEDGAFVAFGTRTAPTAELLNLLTAAPMLYQQLTVCFQAFDAMLEECGKVEARGVPMGDLRQLLEAMSGGILGIQKAAQLGAEAAFPEIWSEHKKG